jgi:hypothetical protein
MNDKLIQIGLDSGMLNYVDNETPRHYFLSGHADEQDLQKFAELIVQECVVIVADAVDHREPASTYVSKIKEHFGLIE